jgi:hypothetical protein
VLVGRGPILLYVAAAVGSPTTQARSGTVGRQPTVAGEHCRGQHNSSNFKPLMSASNAAAERSHQVQDTVRSPALVCQYLKTYC